MSVTRRGFCQVDRGRTLDRRRSSPGPLTGPRHARSRRGGARHRTRAERARTPRSGRRAGRVGMTAHAAQPARSAWHPSSRHPPTAEVASPSRPPSPDGGELTSSARSHGCGGHGQPPLCPSDRRCRPESEKGLELAERRTTVPRFRPAHSDLPSRSRFSRSTVQKDWPCGHPPEPRPVSHRRRASVPRRGAGATGSDCGAGAIRSHPAP
jgi:hypothetical protein